MYSNYEFNNLVDDILCNREVEFSFNKNNYYITNVENYWYFFDEGNNKNIKICRFEETDVLAEFVKSLYIGDIHIEEIFDKGLYSDLYIL